MVFGATYMNVTNDKKLFKQVNHFTPPVMSMFFIISGMNLNVTALRTAGIIGSQLFPDSLLENMRELISAAPSQGMPVVMKRYIGLALIPTGRRCHRACIPWTEMLPAEIGSLLLTIILSSSVLYELIGPACAKMSFFLSGTIKREVIKSVEDYQPAHAVK